MSNSTYNPQYWRKKIAAYQEEDWSTKPSPFVQLSARYFKKRSKVLELGAGAGQDGLWLESQGFSVVMSDGDSGLFDSLKKKSTAGSRPVQFDLTKQFPFSDNAFDVVYAQLVLHYFEDKEMLEIMKEIERVLSPGGVLACMVNTIEDPEYKELAKDKSGIIKTDKLLKRYFSVESLKPFVTNFEPLLFNAHGHTPKDDAVGNSGMIQFIGRLNG